jgi:hypothetical protein
MSGDDVVVLLGLGWLVCGAGEDFAVGDAVLQAVGVNAAADNPVTNSRLEITPSA